MRLKSLLILTLAVLSGAYAVCSPSPPLASDFLADLSIKFSDPSVVTLFWTPANISSCPGAIENYVVVQANLTGQTLEPVYNDVLCNVSYAYSCNVSIPFLESLENSQGVIVSFFVLLYYYPNASPIYDNSAYQFTFCSSAPPLPAEIISPVSGTVYLFPQSKFNTSYASITFDWQAGSPAAGDFGRDCSASSSYEALLVVSQDYNDLQQTSLSNISDFYYSNAFAAAVSSSYPLALDFGLGSTNPVFSSAGVWYWRVMRTNSMYMVGSVTYNFTVQSYPDPCSPVCNPIGGVCNVTYPFVNGTCNCTSSYTGPTCSDPIPPTPTPTATPTATPTSPGVTPTNTPTSSANPAATPSSGSPNGSPSGSLSQTPTPTLSAGSPSDDPGAIAGGVVGGLLGLVLLVLLLWFLKLRYWGKSFKKDFQDDDISSSAPTELVSTSQQFNSRVSVSNSPQSPTTDSRSSFPQVQPATDSNYSSLPTRTTDDLYISVNSLTFGAVLGQGQFGQVYQATYTGAQVAVKKLKGVDENLMLEEAKMMKSIPPHPNVLQYYGICQVSDEIMMVMEFCDKGNLAAYLRSPSNKLTPQECRQLCCQIASGMWHISLHGIIHRDLRAENILLRGTPLEAKVADFGLARSLQSHNDNSSDQAYYRMAEIKPIPVAWTPPEVLDPVNRLKYLAASDVWSFGVVMWEIYSRGAKPFDGNDVQLTVAIIRDANRVVPLLPKPKNCPQDILAIMQSCWAFNPQARPSFEKLFRQLA